MARGAVDGRGGRRRAAGATPSVQASGAGGGGSQPERGRTAGRARGGAQRMLEPRGGGGAAGHVGLEGLFDRRVAPRERHLRGAQRRRQDASDAALDPDRRGAAAPPCAGRRRQSQRRVQGATAAKAEEEGPWRWAVRVRALGRGVLAGFETVQRGGVQAERVEADAEVLAPRTHPPRRAERLQPKARDQRRCSGDGCRHAAKRCVMRARDVYAHARGEAARTCWAMTRTSSCAT